MNFKLLTTLFMSALILTACNGIQEEAQDVVDETVETSDQVLDKAKEEMDTLEYETKEMIDGLKVSINKAEEFADQQVVTENEIANVRSSAFIALNKDAYNEVYDLIEILNVEDITKLRKSNEIITVEDGTTVKVIETNVTEAKVQVIDTGEIGYIHISLLTQSS